MIVGNKIQKIQKKNTKRGETFSGAKKIPKNIDPIFGIFPTLLTFCKIDIILCNAMQLLIIYNKT